MIGAGSSITDVAEFNRRAFIALSAVDLQGDFVSNCRERILAGRDLSPDQQKALYNIVHRYRGQITDRLVTEYAATKARGSD